MEQRARRPRPHWTPLLAALAMSLLAPAAALAGVVAEAWGNAGKLAYPTAAVVMQ